jgi:hypothetical protein
MIQTLNEHDMLKFKDLSEEEKTRRGILGTLYGPIASIVKSTRNGRKYPDEVWEKVFSSNITKEMLNNGGIPGELDHPTDRTETCSEKIAIMMPEAPKKDKAGHLVARFDIIDTPNGRVAYALAKYGFKFGISSRGTGDTYEDYNGEETVDADTYDFQAFDLVLLPACEDARLKLAESLDTRKMKLSKALNEALDNANEDERKIMKETLDNLEIDYTPENEVIEEDSASTTTPEKDDNKEVPETPLAADDDGADVMKELQESLKTQRELEKQVRTLQEQLSVCYTKEARYSNVLGRTKNELAQAKATNDRLSKTVETLNESLAQCKEAEDHQNRRIAMLESKVSTMKSGTKSLTEDVNTSKTEISSLREQLNSAKESAEKKVKLLNEKHLRETRELESQNAQLQESIADLKKDNQIVMGQYSAKLSKAQSLIEKYKAVAQTAVEKYIKLQATRLGISADEVKRKLNENYSFNDIDRVCEELQKYRLTVNSLPFDMRRHQKDAPVRMTIKESVETIKPINDDGFDIDDDMDTSFLNIK